MSPPGNIGAHAALKISPVPGLDAAYSAPRIDEALSDTHERFNPYYGNAGDDDAGLAERGQRRSGLFIVFMAVIQRFAAPGAEQPFNTRFVTQQCAGEAKPRQAAAIASRLRQLI